MSMPMSAASGAIQPDPIQAATARKAQLSHQMEVDRLANDLTRNQSKISLTGG